jgi:hypothetical protein
VQDLATGTQIHALSRFWVAPIINGKERAAGSDHFAVQVVMQLTPD